MAFVRDFDIALIANLTGENKELYQRLESDVKFGKVFPAVRAGNLDFYFRGGCLFRFDGKRFIRDSKYENYSDYTEGLDYYEKCKKQNENRFSEKERQILDRLNVATFSPDSKVVVVDVEINLNESDGKKCDMVLLNAQSRQIIFVEGKIYQNKEMGMQGGNVPHVIEQVLGYSRAIEIHKEKIEAQYKNHLTIINTLFGTIFPLEVSLVSPAKLLVYSEKSKNKVRDTATAMIEERIGERNIMWNWNGYEPPLDDIWNCLTR